MRLIFIGIVMFSASIAVVDAGETQGGTKTERGNVMQAPVGHRQPTAKDVPPRVDENLGARSPEDQAVDRKLRICRDC